MAKFNDIFGSSSETSEGLNEETNEHLTDESSLDDIIESINEVYNSIDIEGMDRMIQEAYAAKELEKENQLGKSSENQVNANNEHFKDEQTDNNDKKNSDEEFLNTNNGIEAEDDSYTNQDKTNGHIL